MRASVAKKYVNYVQKKRKFKKDLELRPLRKRAHTENVCDTRIVYKGNYRRCGVIPSKYIYDELFC